MFKTRAKVEARFTQLLQNLDALKHNPEAADLQFATTSIYEFAADRERLDLSHGTLIPRAIEKVLSVSLFAPSDDAQHNIKGYDTQTDMLVETTNFLNLRDVRGYLFDRNLQQEDGLLHLSEAVCAWVPKAISPGKVTVGQMNMLHAISICSPHGFTQPVIDLCNEKYKAFVQAGQELLPAGELPSAMDDESRHKLALFNFAQARILELQGCGLLSGSRQQPVQPAKAA
jgi:hypothetical protein